MIAKYVILILSIIILGFTSFYVSIFLAWGKIIDIDNLYWYMGVIIAIFIAVSYRSLKSKNSSIILFAIRSFLLAILVFPGIYFMGYGYIAGGIKEKRSEMLSKSINYKCLHKYFLTPVDTVAIKHGRSYTTYTLYNITHNILHILNEYKEFPPQTDYTKLSEYPKGAKFIVDGYYFARDYASSSRYLLIRSIDDNKTMWLSTYDFNHTTCQMLPKKNYNNRYPDDLNFTNVDIKK